MQGTRTSWYSNASRFEDERCLEGGKDAAGADGGGEEAEVKEDRFCWYREGRRSTEEPWTYVGLVDTSTNSDLPLLSLCA